MIHRSPIREIMKPVPTGLGDWLHTPTPGLLGPDLRPSGRNGGGARSQAPRVRGKGLRSGTAMRGLPM